MQCLKPYDRLGKQQNETCTWSECTGIIIIMDWVQMNAHSGYAIVANIIFIIVLTSGDQCFVQRMGCPGISHP